RHGPEHPEAQALLNKSRNLHLTIDIRLQHRVAEVLARHMGNSAMRGTRISAVVLDASSGDVLASVTYPLPDAAYEDPSSSAVDPDLFDRGFGHATFAPGSTLKLATAMAAFRARGDAAD